MIHSSVLYHGSCVDLSVCFFCIFDSLVPAWAGMKMKATYCRLDLLRDSSHCLGTQLVWTFLGIFIEPLRKQICSTRVSNHSILQVTAMVSMVILLVFTANAPHFFFDHIPTTVSCKKLCTGHIVAIVFFRWFWSIIKWSDLTSNKFLLSWSCNNRWWQEWNGNHKENRNGGGGGIYLPKLREY